MVNNSKFVPTSTALVLLATLTACNSPNVSVKGTSEESTTSGSGTTGSAGASGSTNGSAAIQRTQAVLPPSKPDYFDEALDFNEVLPHRENVSGDLAGELMFVQNTLVSPLPQSDDRPLLVAQRDALLLFTPSDTGVKSLIATINSSDGNTLQIDLQPPEHAPHHDGPHVSGDKVVFDKKAWTAVVPWSAMQPGVSMEFIDDRNKSGTIASDGFVFGAPSELVNFSIKFSLLTTVDKVSDNLWAKPNLHKQHELAVDYFQKVPIAKLTSAQYEPYVVDHVVLGDGTEYTERSADQSAGVYTGDLRVLGKELLATGITLANTGISSSSDIVNFSPLIGVYPPAQFNKGKTARFTAVHTVSGKYTATDDLGEEQAVVVKHGLSGGGRKLTLLSTTGNEYSHEYGHDHGLGHYPGGDKSKQKRDGGWGFDVFKHRMISNLRWQSPAPEADFAYAFNTDAMAGGAASSRYSKFTLHTPYSLQLIQNNFAAQSGVINQDSATGYSQWDSQTQQLLDSPTDAPKANSVGVAVTTLLGYYDPEGSSDLKTFIYPAMHANWGQYFSPENVNAALPGLQNSTCELIVENASGTERIFKLHDQRTREAQMNRFHVNVLASDELTQATVICNGGLLASRVLEGPGIDMGVPAIVGKDHGWKHAALRIPADSVQLPEESMIGLEQYHPAMEAAYGRIDAYSDELMIEAGRTYNIGSQYYQALTDNPSSSPNSNTTDWRLVGQAQDSWQSDHVLTLGEASIDFARDYWGETSVYYTTPMDGKSIFACDTCTTNQRGWYKAGQYSTLTVLGEDAEGAQAMINLRGQKNDRYVLGRGDGKYDASRLRFSYHAEDNPELAPGSYSVAFTAYAHGWHKPVMIAIAVSGVIGAN